jgi:DNA adenine methylase
MASIQTKSIYGSWYRQRSWYDNQNNQYWEHIGKAEPPERFATDITEIYGIGQKTANKFALDYVYDIFESPLQSMLWSSSCRCNQRTIDELLEYAEKPAHAVRAGMFVDSNTLNEMEEWEEENGLIDPSGKFGVDLDLIDTLVDKYDYSTVEYIYETKEYVRAKGTAKISVAIGNDIEEKYGRNILNFIDRISDELYVAQGVENAPLLGTFNGQYAFVLAPLQTVECVSPDRDAGTFNYMGSKHNLAGWISDYVPDHDVYVEAFGGSGGLLASKPVSDQEVYNDINSFCTDFFDVIKHQSDELVEWLRNTPYSAEMQQEYVQRVEAREYDDVIEKVGMWYYASFSTFACLQRQGSANFRRSLDNKNPISITFRRAVENLVKARDRFRDVQIESMDYRELVDRYDKEASDVFFYFDPPYVEKGDEYYDHEGAFDHRKFVDVLREIDGKWMVSYGDEYPDELDDIAVYSTEKMYNSSLTGEAKEEYPERLIMNYHPEDESAFEGERDITLADLV